MHAHTTTSVSTGDPDPVLTEHHAIDPDFRSRLQELQQALNHGIIPILDRADDEERADIAARLLPLFSGCTEHSEQLIAAG